MSDQCVRWLRVRSPFAIRAFFSRFPTAVLLVPEVARTTFAPPESVCRLIFFAFRTMFDGKRQISWK
jgi:hypothetical protein